MRFCPPCPSRTGSPPTTDLWPLANTRRSSGWSTNTLGINTVPRQAPSVRKVLTKNPQSPDRVVLENTEVPHYQPLVWQGYCGHQGDSEHARQLPHFFESQITPPKK